MGRRLRDLIFDLIRRGVKIDEAKKIIAKFLVAEGLSGRIHDLKRIKDFSMLTKQFTWVFERGIDADRRRASTEILTTTADGFALMNKKINKRAVQFIRDALRKDITHDDVVKEAPKFIKMSVMVTKKVNIYEHNIRTIALTARAAFSRADTILLAPSEARFRFVGPPTAEAYSHKFCILQYALAKEGKTYTRAEIEELDNGSDTSALYYCGGYRCRHWWEEVLEAIKQNEFRKAA